MWTIELGDCDADLWRAALEGTDATEPTPSTRRRPGCAANLDRSAAPSRDRATRRRVDEIAEARARHFFG